MKILACFFPIDDMGGIINHHEQLCAGLRELGHEVVTKLLVWRDVAPRSKAGGTDERGVCGLMFDQRKGFSWGADDIIAYKGGLNMAQWYEFSSKFDLIIWQVAVPTKRAENRGNMDWIRLYMTPVKQIAVIHDGNFLASYPWLAYVRKSLTGLACVHHCGYNSGGHIDIPRALIFNPFKIHKPDLSWEAWRAREKGFLSVQTWKAWKHVPELLTALPHAGDITKLVAGKGIDYYYLTSEDKCKYPGVWESAQAADMNYLGVISNQRRDELLRQVTCLVDPSWSRKYSQIGGHFNRTPVEAILQGALPLVRPLGISTNTTGHGELFRHDHNCLCIPQWASPREYGQFLEYACRLEYGPYLRLMENAIMMLPKFGRQHVAQQFIDLANGKDTVTGVLSAQVLADGGKALGEFFNDQPADA